MCGTAPSTPSVRSGPPSAGRAKGGRRRVPASSRSADVADPPAESSNACVGVTQTSATPPAANPTSCAFWATSRSNERACGNPAVPTSSGSVAVRVPVNTGWTSPFTASRPSRTGTGRPRTAISASSPAVSTSQATSTSRLGRRRPTPPSRTPPIPIGTNAMPNVRAARSGEPVRW